MRCRHKHALSVRLNRIEYIEPYPKSRAVRMFSEGAEYKLVPFAGVAPRRYMEIFDDRPAFVSDPLGYFLHTTGESLSHCSARSAKMKTWG
jgi:cytidine deaminase